MVSTLALWAGLALGADLAVDAAVSVATGLAPLRMVEDRPAIPDSAWAEAAAGGVAVGVETVPGFEARKTWGVTVISRPISEVWAAINEERLIPDYTNIAYAELVRGSSCAAGRHVLQVLPMGVPGIDDRWWVTVRTPNARLQASTGGNARELVWRSAPDGSDVRSERGRALIADATMLKFTKGAWLLVAVDAQRTLVELYSWVDPGGSLSPSLASAFAGKTVRSTFSQIERMAQDSRLTCR
jgi:hypothetical protein